MKKWYLQTKSFAITEKSELLANTRISNKLKKLQVNQKKINSDFENLEGFLSLGSSTTKYFHITGPYDFKPYRPQLNLSMSNPKEQLLDHSIIFQVG